MCDNIKGTLFIGNGASNSTVIGSLYPGLQYSISITAANLLGKGMEKYDSVTLNSDGMWFITREISFLVNYKSYYFLDSPTGAPLLQPPVVVSSTAVKLSWEEINCTQINGVITGYNIQYHPNKEPQSVFINVTAVTNVTITDLTEFRLYYIRIAAINNNGMGPYSQEFSFYTG